MNALRRVVGSGVTCFNMVSEREKPNLKIFRLALRRVIRIRITNRATLALFLSMTS